MLPSVCVGLIWGHGSLAAAGWLATLGELPGLKTAMLAIEWTALLPLAISAALIHRTVQPLEAALAHGLPAPAMPLPALAGGLLALAGTLLAQHDRSARRVVLLSVVALLAVSFSAAVPLAQAVAGERSAERLFMRMAEGDEPAWERPAARSAARMLVAEHPRSRWASEAWRVIAIDAELDGRRTDAIAAWSEYRACFGEQPLPGSALASFNIARLMDGAAPGCVVAGHYQRAFETLRRADGDTQSWIAARSAAELERIHRDRGLVATAVQWAVRARTYEPRTEIEREGNDDGHL